MAFVVRKGTVVRVRKAAGDVVAHVCRKDCVFTSNQQVAAYQVMQFRMGEFLISVKATDVTEIFFQCPQCGDRVEIEGLCNQCRRKWLPRSDSSDHFEP